MNKTDTVLAREVVSNQHIQTSLSIAEVNSKNSTKYIVVVDYSALKRVQGIPVKSGKSLSFTDKGEAEAYYSLTLSNVKRFRDLDLRYLLKVYQLESLKRIRYEDFVVYEVNVHRIRSTIARLRRRITIKA